MFDVSEPMQSSWSHTLRTRLSDYWALTKPRLNALVVMTTFVGFYLASSRPMDLLLLLHTVLGTFIVAGGASALNQVWERENDARMRRTQNRPLPTGRLAMRDGVLFGVLMGLSGTLYLLFAVNVLTAVLGFLSFVIYVLVYTPMKARSAWNTVMGAISGALPPVMGWTAVRDTLGLEPLVLFAILFFWQHPHFFALSWKYREDYRQGGFRMLSFNDESGNRSGLVMIFMAAPLLPLAAALTPLGLTGTLYMYVSFVLGMMYLLACVYFASFRTEKTAGKAFFASLIYLTLLLVVMLGDKQG
ncbi:MAG: heme o synthase [Myxococcota bacterium]